MFTAVSQASKQLNFEMFVVFFIHQLEAINLCLTQYWYKGDNPTGLHFSNM